MKRFQNEKLKIPNYFDYMEIEAFQRGIICESNLLVELTKIISRTLNESYLKEHKFVYLEREMKINKNKSGETFRKNIRVSLEYRASFKN